MVWIIINTILIMMGLRRLALIERKLNELNAMAFAEGRG